MTPVKAIRVGVGLYNVYTHHHTYRYLCVELIRLLICHIVSYSWSSERSAARRKGSGVRRSTVRVQVPERGFEASADHHLVERKRSAKG